MEGRLGATKTRTVSYGKGGRIVQSFSRIIRGRLRSPTPPLPHASHILYEISKTILALSPSRG